MHAARDSLHVVLVEPEIHGNTGNIGRTCLATGARLHLVEPLGFSLDSAKVKRAGLDYWPRVRPQVWPGWERFEEALPDLGAPWFFTAEAETTVWEPQYRDPAVLVFGRESVGLDASIRRRYADRLVRIPIADSGVRSLNLSNAVAIALFEVVRQRRGEVREGERIG